MILKELIDVAKKRRQQQQQQQHTTTTKTNKKLWSYTVRQGGTKARDLALTMGWRECEQIDRLYEAAVKEEVVSGGESASVVCFEASITAHTHTHTHTTFS